MKKRRVQTETWTVDGRKARVRRLTAGEMQTTSIQSPLVLLHGLGCSSDAWMPALRHLARHPAAPAVVAPDFPGCGHSSSPGHALGMDELADWTARLLDEMGIGHAHLAGNSMGCQVVLAFARRHPARTVGTILAGPTTGGQDVSLLRYAAGLLTDAAHESVRYNATLLKMYLQMGLKRYLATVAKMQADDPLARIKAVPGPCLILRGSNDSIVPDRAARHLASELTDGAYSEVARQAHALQFNHPQAFVENTLAFLTGVEAGARE